ncbi:MAG: extracellular solute-binding protein [Oscillospiraceae bacterium]|nr:extracellular solute-binding protein [Oscillospiraceae bacterium]
MKKFTALIIILALCLFPAVLISCGDGGGANQDGGDNPNNNISGSGDSVNQDGENPSVGEARIEPELPEKDFENYTFTFFAHQIDYPGDWVGDSDPREIVAEEENADPINDAVYIRNRKIEAEYNINIEMIARPDDVGILRRAVGSGDSTYDAAVIFNNNIPGVVTNNLLVNIDNLPFVDIDKPWWDPAVKEMSIANQNYLLGGDLLILDNEATNGLLFNKDLMADFGIELPYNLVKSGKWTMDAMHDMIKGAEADLNGDGTMGPEDRWGFVVGIDVLHALLVSGGGLLAEKDENDVPYMTFTNPKNLLILDKTMELLYNPEYVVNIHTREEYGDYHSMFEDGRVLFLWMRMRVVESLRGMEGNFGIIPMPKFDENQENYHSVVNPYTGVLLGVPKSAEDLERVSIVLEALSAESRYTLQPAYYDVTLQRKHMRDEESSEMLDIIFNSRVYDIGGVYSFGGVWRDFIELSRNNNRNIISFYEGRLARMERDIERIVETFMSME